MVLGSDDTDSANMELEYKRVEILHHVAFVPYLVNRSGPLEPFTQLKWYKKSVAEAFAAAEGSKKGKKRVRGA